MPRTQALIKHPGLSRGAIVIEGRIVGGSFIYLFSLFFFQHIPMELATGELQLEQEKLFNFLKKYDLQAYYTKFLLKGVHRVNYLKDVVGDDASMDEIGLSRIERVRLRNKIRENLSWKGKFKVIYCS